MPSKRNTRSKSPTVSAGSSRAFQTEQDNYSCLSNRPSECSKECTSVCSGACCTPDICSVKFKNDAKKVQKCEKQCGLDPETPPKLPQLKRFSIQTPKEQLQSKNVCQSIHPSLDKLKGISDSPSLRSYAILAIKPERVDNEHKTHDEKTESPPNAEEVKSSSKMPITATEKPSEVVETAETNKQEPAEPKEEEKPSKDVDNEEEGKEENATATEPREHQEEEKAASNNGIRKTSIIKHHENKTEQIPSQSSFLGELKSPESNGVLMISRSSVQFELDPSNTDEDETSVRRTRNSLCRKPLCPTACLDKEDDYEYQCAPSCTGSSLSSKDSSRVRAMPPYGPTNPRRQGCHIAGNTSYIKSSYFHKKKDKKSKKELKKKAKSSKTSIKSNMSETCNCGPDKKETEGCSCHFPPAFKHYFRCTGTLTGFCCCADKK